MIRSQQQWSRTALDVWFVRSALTVQVSVLGRGGDPPVLDLDVLHAGPAVELVDPDLPAAHLVRLCALRPHILVKIRRRVILPLFYMQREK